MYLSKENIQIIFINTNSIASWVILIQFNIWAPNFTSSHKYVTKLDLYAKKKCITKCFLWRQNDFKSLLDIIKQSYKLYVQQSKVNRNEQKHHLIISVNNSKKCNQLNSKSSREDMCRLPTSFLLNIQSHVKQEVDMP